MIGQEKLKYKIKAQIEARKYPRCSIFIGPEGSGKRTLSKWIATKLSAHHVIVSGKIDDVRQVIQLANSSHLKTLYVFANVDTMSNNAQNALLKLLEEPPNNAYIMVTALSEDNLLNTIISRGVVYYMQPYTPQEIQEYYEGPEEVVRQVCETPGEVDLLVASGIDKVYDYASLVADNIGQVTGANALKIGSKIAFKDEADKINLKIFFKVFLAVCYDECYIHIDETYANWIVITLNYLRQLNIKGVNKSMLFDSWVLDCRQILF